VSNGDRSTYDTLKKSTNGLVCYDRSGFPCSSRSRSTCTTEATSARQTEPRRRGARRQNEVEARLAEQEKADARQACLWLGLVSTCGPIRVTRDHT